MFQIKDSPILSTDLHPELNSTSAGAFVSFEGRVRNHNEGKTVLSLEYQVYKELAIKEGNKILNEAKDKFSIIEAQAIHREGHLQLGDIAILIGTISKHRKEAYLANKFIIDQIKQRLPIWKKEHYENSENRWVFCKDHLHHHHFSENEFYEKQSKIINQSKISKAKVLVIGAGGLGSSVLIGLAQAGVGHIGILEYDKVDISNIQRQFLYSSNQVGEDKGLIAKVKLQEINPFIRIDHFKLELNYSNSEDILKSFDFIIDCTDNLATKYAIHDLSFKLKIPFLSGSLFKKVGIIRTFNPQNSLGCHRCFSIKEQKDHVTGNCNDFGVLGVTANIIGSSMASEVLNFIEKGENTSFLETLLFDTQSMNIQKIKNKKNSNCQFCHHIEKFQTRFTDYKVFKDDFLPVDRILNIDHMSIEEIIKTLSPTNRNILFCKKGIKSRSIVLELREQGLQNVFFSEENLCSH